MPFTCMPCLKLHLCALMQALSNTLKGFQDGSDMIVHWDALEASSTPQPREPNSPESDSMQR